MTHPYFVMYQPFVRRQDFCKRSSRDLYDLAEYGEVVEEENLAAAAVS